MFLSVTEQRSYVNTACLAARTPRIRMNDWRGSGCARLRHYLGRNHHPFICVHLTLLLTATLCVTLASSAPQQGRFVSCYHHAAIIKGGSSLTYSIGQS
jgi:hypothetical protein